MLALQLELPVEVHRIGLVVGLVGRRRAVEDVVGADVEDPPAVFIWEKEEQSISDKFLYFSFCHATTDHYWRTK